MEQEECNHHVCKDLACVADIPFPLSRRGNQASKQANAHGVSRKWGSEVKRPPCSLFFFRTRSQLHFLHLLFEMHGT